MRAWIDEIELEYERAGSGPPIVFTHGIGGTGADWAPLLPMLTPRFECITWDVRGFGRSSRPATGYGIDILARDLAGLLDALGLEHAVIAGTSMGGVISQRFLLGYPERARAAILMSTSSEVNERARAIWFAQAEAIERDGMAAWLARARPAEQTEEQRQAEARRLENNPDAPVYAQVTRAVAEYNYTAALETVGVPTLVLVGSEDTQTPPGGSVIISRRIPGAELHILPGFGHGLAREAPEKVGSLITEFLGRVLD